MAYNMIFLNTYPLYIDAYIIWLGQSSAECNRFSMYKETHSEGLDDLSRFTWLVISRAGLSPHGLLSHDIVSWMANVQQNVSLWVGEEAQDQSVPVDAASVKALIPDPNQLSALCHHTVKEERSYLGSILSGNLILLMVTHKDSTI